MRSSGSRGVEFTHRLGAVLVTALAAALVAVACKKTPPPGYVATGGIPECPGDGFRLTFDSAHTLVTMTQLELVNPITDIPEFHDCQRFIKRDGTYDTRYAIFAIARLDSLAQYWPAADSARPDTARGGFQRKSRTAAVIYSWGGTYPQLTIGPGFNCLLMYRDAGYRWQATMLHLGPNAPVCPETVEGDNVARVGYPLQTVQLPAPQAGYQDGDYPPVARWDWDSTNAQQYISIRCGSAWCEIGNRGGFVGMRGLTATVTFPSNTGPVTPPMHRPRTVEIRGWHDLQELAVAAPGGGLRPSGIRGVVYPAKGLGEYDNEIDFRPTALSPWVVSGYADMTADYVNSKVQFMRGLNRVSLCHGTRAECRVPDAPLPAKCTSGPWDWWARTESQNARTRYTCVTMMPHLGHDIPAAVRWRWDETDETMWLRCTQGCCKLEG